MRLSLGRFHGQSAFAASLLNCAAVLPAFSPALAQTAGQPSPARVLVELPYNIGDAVRQANAAYQPPLAQLPAVPVLPQLVEPQLTLPSNEKLMIRHIEVDGADAASQEEVRALLAPYEGRWLTLSEIYEAADKITTLYRERGFLVAKAYVPAQDARKGTLRIKLVAGRFGQVSVKDESLVREDFLKDVIDTALADDPQIHKAALERAMLLVSDLPGAGMPRVAIAPGQQPETSDFVFSVPQGKSVDGYLLGDNGGSRYTGRDRLSGGLNINSPLGFGDRLSLFGVISQTKGLLNGRAAYSFPIGYDGLRGEIGAYKTTYVLGGIYSGLDATGDASAIYATLNYAILRSREESLYVSGIFTHKSLDDRVFGISTASREINLGTINLTNDTFGVINGMPLSTSVSLSYTAGYVNFADPEQLLANEQTIRTAGHYDRLNLYANANLGLSENLSFLMLLRGQKALSGSLDTSEQMTLSGFWGVRSYDEGLSADSGYLVMPEFRLALPALPQYQHSLGFFTDVAGGWLENATYSTVQRRFTQINDIGLGYYMTYEYMPGRFLTGKGLLAHTYGSNGGLTSYDRETKGLVQIGITF
ncbi:ShlB/FhaC/HecB family hemolysin secretion/activation protein [Beijerinckia indica]|uniref:Polypeptide-transport-associated domain protein ShlB-type n=1 Tax=Beijerinckia indica subsp. indica (strain ATCC 9039 / DSM 1715 / NCIMB 8712) TaxID=395963 RepID=B2IBJ6_BEII9|nr:ShlB/FhaC/HecB family hemolysin secretion/activation protein [Beijerinckia indica]ACB96622.1 Polypeptide-transport-associated domain protein ShlB-type [Beijerinckia indica subsp. indica ATCC 9039]